MAKEQSVAKQSDTGALVIATERPAYLPAVVDGAVARGSEGVSTADLVIPRLELVQDLSPCRKKDDPTYIPGAEEGMLYNNVTRQLYGKQVIIVPVLFRKEFLIWKDRKKGGGFRGAFPDELSAKQHMETLEDKDDCTVQDTAQHFVLILRNDNGRPVAEEAVISMAKSKMKVSRNWNSVIRINGGDRFSRAYQVEAVPDRNANNESFYNLKVTMLGFCPEWAYKKAEELYNGVTGGGVVIQADHSIDTGAPVGDGANSEM
jgi:hypothetical protein